MRRITLPLLLPLDCLFQLRPSAIFKTPLIGSVEAPSTIDDVAIFLFGEFASNFHCHCGPIFSSTSLVTVFVICRVSPMLSWFRCILKGSSVGVRLRIDCVSFDSQPRRFSVCCAKAWNHLPLLSYGTSRQTSPSPRGIL
ncbi:hypothetical protein BGX38DRAFT_59091 [Terfezia claveryi]|nr:hypothetical protein BGX38DRAFT_59091 [Terfezia claveryi]